MMRSHRRAGWLVGLMVAVSLVLAPRGGAAWGPKPLPDPGPPNEGDPDGPDNSRYPVGRGIYLEFAGPNLLFVRVSVLPKPAHLVDRRAVPTSRPLRPQDRRR